MLNKKEQRLRRARQTRERIAKQGVARLTVFRSNLHIYASVISEDGGRVLAWASTAQEDLRSTLHDLADKKRRGELDFDRVVIETTGLADPGPVAQTFFMDDEIAESYLLDSILTLVDAKHAVAQRNDRPKRGFAHGG